MSAEEEEAKAMDAYFRGVVPWEMYLEEAQAYMRRALQDFVDANYEDAVRWMYRAQAGLMELREDATSPEAKEWFTEAIVVTVRYRRAAQTLWRAEDSPEHVQEVMFTCLSRHIDEAGKALEEWVPYVAPMPPHEASPQEKLASIIFAACNSELVS